MPDVRADYTVVGKSYPAIDALEKVTGQAIYGTDLKLPGMLWGKVLRSPFPHARILNIDSRKARRVPGVRAVVGGEMVPKGRFGLALKDQPIMAWDKARLIGDAVAAVAACDEDAAEEALSLVKVDYQELPAVFDPLEAMKPAAPLIHERLGEYWSRPGVIRTMPGTNICNHFRLRKGEVDAGFGSCQHLFESTFSVPMAQHVPLETHAAVASTSPDGKITVWSCTQAPYQLRQNLADAFQIPLTRARVVPSCVGAGFGAKILAKIEPIAALLSFSSRRPVKMVLSRGEEFACTAVRHPAVIDVKLGIDQVGLFQALKLQIIWDTGAYSEHGPVVSRNGGFSSPGPYQIPQVAVVSYCVYTNKPMAGAYRGFGLTKTAWALESQIDIAAESLGIDPLELRLRNSARDGTVSATGEVLRSVGISACLKKCAERLTAEKDGTGQKVGRGIAGMHKHTRAFAPSCAFIKINEDGTIGLITSAMDIGQGSSTVLAQIAAEEFKVPLQDVVLARPDTDATPFDTGTMSSRITFHVGNAIRMAADDAKGKLLELASDMLEAKPGDLVLRDKKVFVQGSPEKAVSLAQLAAISHSSKSGPILGRGSYLQDDLTSLDLETGQGAKPVDYWKYAACAVELEVDEETGQIHIARLIAAADAGFAINPLAVDGQIQGAAAMGLGGALMEEMVFEGGRLLNASLMDYNLPTSLDVPRIESVTVEVNHPDGPFGAKGMGEAPTPVVAPALANALSNALRVRIKDLPLTQEKVFWALKGRGK